MTRKDKYKPNKNKPQDTPEAMTTGRPFGYLAKGMAAASVTGAMFMMSPVHKAVAADNPYLQKFGADNPLHAPIGSIARSHSALVDIDDDGDLDLFIGGQDGTIDYFENTGSASAAEFSGRTGTANPFNGMDIDDNDSQDYAAPAFADLDGDGDLDAGIGADDGYIHYFENTGTASAPSFAERSGSDSPFWYSNTDGTYYPFYFGGDSVPQFADIDGDNDMDVVVGRYDGHFSYLENNAGTFTLYDYNQTQNPFANIDLGDNSSPGMFADIDDDGDVDWFGGESNGYLYFLENNGNGTFTSHSGNDTENPFYQVDIGNQAAPIFVDLDNDGDTDAIIDGYGGGGGMLAQLNYFENVGDDADPLFTERTGTRSPFSGFDVGLMSKPVFVDIDGDGDMDAFSGEKYEESGSIDFFENIGTASAPSFVQRKDDRNPLYGVDPGYGSLVAFADIDGDGDMDAFVSAKYNESGVVSAVDFYENTGSATDPEFVKKGDASNPLFFVESEFNQSLSFVDIDGDGDMDAFLTGAGFSMKYVQGPDEFWPIFKPSIDFYENVGSATDPKFVSGFNSNPLKNVLDPAVDVYGSVYSLAFQDIDGDGDLDAVIGSSTSQINPFGWKYGGNSRAFQLEMYENVGTDTDPAFAPVPEANDAFAKIREGLDDDDSFLSPAFVDIDGDGDIDVFAGEYFGRFLFFQNQTDPAPTAVGIGSGSSGSSSTCFVDTAQGTAADSAENNTLLARTGRRLIAAVTAIWR